MDKTDIPIKDPTPQLSPTATRILEAAKRILRERGFASLTFEAIARESGEHPSLIRYHFGSKAGLIAVLVDSVMHLESLTILQTLATSEQGASRRRALLRLHRDIARDVDAYRMFFDLVPHVVRDEALRKRFRALFDWYRDLDAWALSPAATPAWAERLRPLALLTVALADGVALQVQADPDLEIDAAFNLWEAMVERQVRELEAVRTDPTA